MPHHKNSVLQEFIKKLFTLVKNQQLPPWQKPWRAKYGVQLSKPHNPVTKQSYSGLNALYLSLTGELNGYQDPRWMGFHQAQQAGWSIRPQERGTIIYIPIIQKYRSDVRDCDLKPQQENNLSQSIWFKTARVFNAEQLIGIPPLEEITQDPINKNNNQPLEVIAKRMGVKIIETSSDVAYYAPHIDMIRLPLAHQFITAYGRDSTLAHELAHASGNERRLARNQEGTFGSLVYCIEEITAEIGSYLLCRELGLHFNAQRHDQSEEQHLAYTGHWINLLRDDSKNIELAISQGIEAAKFLHQQWLIENMEHPI
ncbi:MAG: DUF1738 domain-containing protein [Betaproteobacteria bacterium]|nr:DUF1738 domain-containing protein [Betaproteobacteria bacterium]